MLHVLDSETVLVRQSENAPENAESMVQMRKDCAECGRVGRYAVLYGYQYHHGNQYSLGLQGR